MTTSFRGARLQRLLLASTTGLSLVAITDLARAAGSEQMLRTAESACLDSAVQQGWRRDLAKVVSSRAIDNDRVEVVLDLSKDGTGTARLTCPYSARQGVMGQLGAVGDAIGSTAGKTAEAVQPSSAWWLLLPAGLAALLWAGLRGRRHEHASLPQGAVHYGSGVGQRTADAFVAVARSRDGLRDAEVRVHELADGASMVRRRIRNGDQLSLTGRRAQEWLEVDGGGWVHEADLLFDRAAVAAGRRLS